MIVETHNNLTGAQRIEASRVVIYGDDGTPLGVVMKVMNGYQMLRAGDQGFANALRALGIDRTVVVEQLQLEPPPGSRQPLQLQGLR